MPIEPKPPEIMVADDTVASLKISEEMLTDQGCQVRLFSAGMLLLAAAKVELPDLILLARQMPDMDGFDLCARLKAEPVLATIPVIFMISQHETKDLARAYHVGGADYLIKPLLAAEVEARVRTQLELRRQTLELRHFEERLNCLDLQHFNLAKMVLHDMRSPVQTIMMAVEVGGGAGQKIAQYLEMTGTSARKLKELADHLEGIILLKAGRRRITPTRGDLVRLAQAEMEAQQSRARDRRICLHAPEPLWANYDQDLTSRILGHLVGNALKFTPAEADVIITVKREGNRAVLSVMDKGPKIRVEDQEKIFEMPGQLPGEKPVCGSGLGLIFCKLAVEAQGGTIGVESRSNQSNTFWFTLPLPAE